MTTSVKRKLSNLHVRSIEEEILLIRESEERWWEIDARDAYVRWLKLINNLKI